MADDEFTCAFWSLRSSGEDARIPTLRVDDLRETVAVLDIEGYPFADVIDFEADICAACLV